MEEEIVHSGDKLTIRASEQDDILDVALAGELSRYTIPDCRDRVID